MAVDFAYKLRKRSGKGAILRNIKLRISRKLIYASGLLSCFSCSSGIGQYSNKEKCPYKSPTSRSKTPECIECLRLFMQKTPLEILATFFYLDEGLNSTAKKTFDAYDKFLGLIGASNKRKHLDDLKIEDAESDEVYQEARSISHEFRDGISELFFSKKLVELTKIYGVF